MSDGITEARRSMTNRVQTYYQKRPKVKAIQYKIENLEEVKSFLDGFYIEVVDDNKLLIHNNTGPDVLVPVGNYITNDMFNNVHHKAAIYIAASVNLAGIKFKTSSSRAGKVPKLR